MTNADKKEISVLEAVQAVSAAIGKSKMPLLVQIEEAFEEIVALQKKGVSLSEIARGINEKGVTISEGYLKTIMYRIRKKRKSKTENKSLKPALKSKSAVSAEKQVPAVAKSENATGINIRNDRDESELF